MSKIVKIRGGPQEKLVGAAKTGVSLFFDTLIDGRDGGGVRGTVSTSPAGAFE